MGAFSNFNERGDKFFDKVVAYLVKASKLCLHIFESSNQPDRGDNHGCISW